MVYRVYVEKKAEFSNEANQMKDTLINLLNISGITGLRIIQRYDIEDVSEDLFKKAVKYVLSEPQTDKVFYDLKDQKYDKILGFEYLPGQFDQRANSASQCIQIMSMCDAPAVKSAKFILLNGVISSEEMNRIKSYIINPVECREASMEKYITLKEDYRKPDEIEQISNFLSMSDSELEKFIDENSLAMDLSDIKMCRDYFNEEKRNPTWTEIKVIDTYWSDHCRHTTFNTIIDYISFDDDMVMNAFDEYLNMRIELKREKPITLMDMGTIVCKSLKAKGMLKKLDESDEINACTVKVNVSFEEAEDEEWLLLFKNETHNHPTEIEPFGGAATCVGGAIRDPLSGRSYVYSAMRLTGASNPKESIYDTLKGKLPQRTIVTSAAKGYSSYGNQIGLATGMVDEIYHSGYKAKRMEIGAVIGAAPATSVVREQPMPGDLVILLGGKTGRDGCGGATGSSKSHTLTSIEDCGAEVQKGNAPEERKLQRLFRNPECSRLIKRCNDFGAGGVSVAIGELAEGLDIDLDKVPKKYEGLDGTELAISESQERMAVVIASENLSTFMKMAADENLEATVVAEVTDKARLVMNWQNKTIVDISRAFLDTNGATKHISAHIEKGARIEKKTDDDFIEAYKSLVSDLNVCSKQGLSENFDSTIGAGTVFMPFGGKHQRTPVQTMSNIISSPDKTATTASVMSWGYNPFITETNPFIGGYYAVIESVSKLIASGASFNEIYLSFQEYFPKLGKDSSKWGKPISALLGAFKAQNELSVPAIGGKDSMSGTFEDLEVPPTLVSFAVTTEDCRHLISPEFKHENSKVLWIRPEIDDNGIFNIKSLINIYHNINMLIKFGKALSCYTPTFGGVAEAVFKMCIGNNTGFTFNGDITVDELFSYSYGSFIVELRDETDLGKICKTISGNCVVLGCTNGDKKLIYDDKIVNLSELFHLYNDNLEEIYPQKCSILKKNKDVYNIDYNKPKANINNNSNGAFVMRNSKPKVLIPVFPGTNCEYDTMKAFEKAGGATELYIIKNLSSEDIKLSVSEFARKINEANIVFIPGGFSGGDEPDGSGKFITSFFRNDEVRLAVEKLMNQRDGLMGGICNGFQALIKLGLLPYGKILDVDDKSPTLTFNTIGRHQSKLVRTRVSSTMSPWTANCNIGDIYTVPVSHGEGRFVADDKVLKDMMCKGQIMTQYVDDKGIATMETQFNPNGSTLAIEGITSPDGRIMGKMGHSERIGANLYKNVPGIYDMNLFKSAINYFK